MTYVVYKVGQISGSNESFSRIMSDDDVDNLRDNANHFFADPDNFIGRNDEQLVIPRGQLQSNVVTTKAGDKEYRRYIVIREIGKAK